MCWRVKKKLFAFHQVQKIVFKLGVKQKFITKKIHFIRLGYQMVLPIEINKTHLGPI